MRLDDMTLDQLRTVIQMKEFDLRHNYPAFNALEKAGIDPFELVRLVNKINQQNS